jgi:amino acid permease
MFAKVSLMSLIAVVYLTLAVVVRSAMLYPERLPVPDAWVFARADYFQSIAIISFAYVCHQNVLQIYSSIRRMERHRFNVATHLSIFIALCFYALIGISGYVTFTTKTEGNILNNFKRDDTVIVIARFALGFTMLFTYPLVTCVGREVSLMACLIPCRVRIYDYNTVYLFSLIQIGFGSDTFSRSRFLSWTTRNSHYFDFDTSPGGFSFDG